jgi:L-threonylcarbamoyladenylate synthase
MISTDINRAVALLQSGGIVALPTETVYGLAGNALDSSAVAKIFAAKNRPQDNPLIVHVTGIDMARGLGLQVTPLAERLAEAFWPGALTIVLNKIDDLIPPEISCGLDSVAVRAPDSPIMLDIIGKCGFPLAAPSANLSGSPSPTTVAHVREDFGDDFPAVDGGSCRIGIESTVVTLEGDKICLLRPGAVTPEMLRKFGEVIVSEGESRLSPGTRYKHYSPKARVVAVDGDVTGMGEFVIAEPDTQTLFAKFREFDSLGASEIYVRLPDKSGVGLALHNRIMKATGGG